MTRARPRIVALVLTAVAGATALALAAPPRDPDWTAALIARTDDIAKEVSKLRGLKIRKPIQRDVMDEAGLRARLVQRFGEEFTAEQLAAEQLALERWGLVAPGVVIHDVLLDVLTEQIAGFYDPAEGKLYIAARTDAKGSADADNADMLMAHEIVHALQDQHFDLDKLTDLPDAESDAALARQALVEGDGVVLMFELLLARQNVPPPWASTDITMLVSAMEAHDGKDKLGAAPLVVRDLLMFPYARGMRFVATLRARHPWSRIDEVFERPPASTEQILHPELYLAGEEPHAVKAATPAALTGWRAVHETVWGEAGWSVLLREHGVSTERATIGAAGWGGDRVVVYAPPQDGDRAVTPGETVAVGLTSWDAEIDAMEFEEAAVDAIEAVAPGTVVEGTRGRTVWLGVDLRVSIVERRGDQVLVAIGVPLAAQGAFADDVWKAWSVAAP